MHIIDIQPLAHGWAVRSDHIDNVLVFRTGAAAEQAALQLADRLASAGIPPEICIRLRDGTLSGRFICRAAEPSCDRQRMAAADHARISERA